jgi:hypothetical protein
VRADAPNGQSFTLVLDVGHGVASVGSEGGGGDLKFDAGGTTFELQGSVTFALLDSCNAEVVYQRMSLSLTPEGLLAGTANGLLRYMRQNLVDTVPVTITLKSVFDTQGPRLTVERGGNLSDPFWTVRLVASEPLPETVNLTLVSAHGDSLPLMPVVDPTYHRPEFQAPGVLRRFGEQYRLSPAGAHDFAGNAVNAEPAFTTNVLPDVLVQDGFESAQQQDVGGGAKLLEGASPPVIAGTKSLYIPPQEGQFSTTTPLFVWRLAVKPGATFIRFSYRTVDVPSGAKYGIAIGFGVGSVGKTVFWSAPVETNAPKVGLPLPDRPDLLVGPLYEAKLGVPTDATDEVFVAGYGGTATCILPSPPQQGIIIDDVRVE